MYVWERSEWPHFTRADTRLIEPLAAARLKQGRLLGSMARLGFDLKLEAQLETLPEDVTTSSEIEGEVLDRDSVRSSIARRLGVPVAAVAPADRRTEDVVGNDARRHAEFAQMRLTHKPSGPSNGRNSGSGSTSGGRCR